MLTRTKIICTIGPAVESYEKIVGLIEAGMNVARLNFSHGSHEEHLKIIHSLKKARKSLGKPLAIMLDTKGPEIRLGTLQSGRTHLEAGQTWLLVPEIIEGNHEKVSIKPGYALKQVEKGASILFNDGYIASRCIRNDSRGVLVEIINSGTIQSNGGVNMPDTALELPAMTETDIEDIRFGCLHDIDIVAASFVRSAEHVLKIKKLIAEENKSHILVMAKIENSEGVHHFDAILQASDGVMIARGDLGVELPLSQVPMLQKMMIRKSYLAGKPAVTATQMLESMIHNPRPTRAEVSDVANAIYDSTSAVMLSGETAVGKYPLEAVKLMNSIVQAAEADFNYHDFFEHHAGVVYQDVPSAVTLATVKAAYSSHAEAILAFTSGGNTARLLSRLRPKMPIIAMTPSETCYHQMSCSWGVIPVLGSECSTLLEAFGQITSYAIDEKLLSYGDLVVLSAGSPFGVSGTTNMMVIESIGDVLVRAISGYGQRRHGKVILVLSADAINPVDAKDKIVVIGKCDQTYDSLLGQCAGVILQNSIDDLDSEKYALNFAQVHNKATLVRADGAFRVLEEGQFVTIDPEKGLVYNRILGVR